MSEESLRTTMIGDLPASWGVESIGELFDVQQGKALSPAARSGHSPRPFLRTANVLWGRLDLNTVDQMDFTDEEASRLSLNPSDLLVCEGGEIGRTALWNGEIEGCLYQNHVHRLRAKIEDVAPDFVMYWMQAALLHLGLYGGIGNRTTIPNLSGARLKQLPIPLPPLREQRGIAAVLARIQTTVAVQDRIVATLKELKAATMAKLFREGLRGEPLKQTEIGEIPFEWAVRPLGSVAKVSTGTTPATDRSEYYAGLIPFVKTAEIDDSTITDCRQHISEGAVDRYRLRVYPPGTIFLAMYGQGRTRGRAAFLAIAAATSQNTAAIEPGEELDSHFIWQYLLGQYEALRNLGNLGHLSHLNLGYVKSLPVPVPPKDEQIEVRDQLSILHRSLETQQRRRAALLVLFSSMLRLLMTGQVRLVSTASAPAQGSTRTSATESSGGRPDEGVIQEIVRRIVAAVAPEKIILFGSAARGEMGPDSDLDFLVVKSCENRRKMAQTIYGNLIGVGVPKDIVVVTPEDVARHRDTIGYIIRPVLREGRVVYVR